MVETFSPDDELDEMDSSRQDKRIAVVLSSPEFHLIRQMRARGRGTWTMQVCKDYYGSGGIAGFDVWEGCCFMLGQEKLDIDDEIIEALHQASNLVKRFDESALNRYKPMLTRDMLGKNWYDKIKDSSLELTRQEASLIGRLRELDAGLYCVVFVKHSHGARGLRKFSVVTILGSS